MMFSLENGECESKLRVKFGKVGVQLFIVTLFNKLIKHN
jgi:hypothetical protein